MRSPNSFWHGMNPFRSTKNLERCDLRLNEDAISRRFSRIYESRCKLWIKSATEIVLPSIGCKRMVRNGKFFLKTMQKQNYLE